VTFSLDLSALLFIVLGTAHSYLGERHVLAPILRLPTLPKLFGSTRYMQQILRLAWHVTSVAWWGLAGITFLLAHPPVTPHAVSLAIGFTALASFLCVLVFTRGKHVAAWIMFLIISLTTIYYGAGLD